ncbi:TNF receptor-associated factor homolog 1a-like isoform X1 [Zingiber officinale]|uniref:TNF receptor-associated factor homolog 1a-like isoform X1 n=2 Tax=Zingiber officinale TaxID=94328 RepID=UPI001C4C04FB|nr:TNF receptor-associated factor homolog 1a-like isoform X1 [Zingiber officinale]
MAGNITEDLGMNLRLPVTDGMLSEQRCLSGDSISEWRSSEQVENGITSTSPSYWDTDDDDDCGPKPSDLYGRFTWRIENFSTINKRELRSDVFEIGGYKWYILIYPQGCDVCNHLSLFLCVANHDKLLPGWSHFAQFTIAVVNKDPKKSKYSDTLHRFWKKEHDWGWKKFMELSKVFDGFIVTDTLVIKAQVQVIREKSDQPFRCLDGQYRRELVRVYLSNVELICRRYLEEKIGKLNKFIEDKVRWSSFRAFWLEIDSSNRWHMSRDKRDAILKVIVKHFFIEKEVTSTLVMDSLYSGLKALEFQSKNLKGRSKSVELEELPAPMVHVDKDLFVLSDDILLLIERVVSDVLPLQPFPSKDDKCLQTRTKEGSSGDEFTKDSIDRDERRLMELGRRTIEVFVLVHIFSSRIEVSYQEAIALERQEELIREEEAAGLAESELKSKRSASEKEKRSKKKQAKQKRNNRKEKEKGKYDRGNLVQEALQQETFDEERNSDSLYSEPVEHNIKKIGAHEDASDVSDTVDVAAEMLQPDLDDRAASPINWDIDASEIHLTTEASGNDVQNGHIDNRSQFIIDDSSSSCSTDSVPSVFITEVYKRAISPVNITQSPPNKGKNHQSKEMHSGISSTMLAETSNLDGSSNNASASKVDQPESAVFVSSLKSDMQQQEIQVDKQVLSLQNKQMPKDQIDVERQSPSSNLGEKQNNTSQLPKQSPTFTTDSPVSTSNNTIELASSKLPNSTSLGDKVLAHSSRSRPMSSSSLSEAQKQNVPAKHNSPQQVNATSRPSSAPLTLAPRSTASISPTVQVVPLLSRSVSAAGRLGIDPSPSAPSYVPQSYRNATLGRTSARTTSSTDVGTSSGQSASYSQSPTVHVSSLLKLPPQTPLRKDQSSIRPGLTFGCLNLEAICSQQLCKDGNQHESSSSSVSESSSQRYASSLMDNNMEKLNVYGIVQNELVGTASSSLPSQVHGTIAEEFPHLDIINDLLDDEQNIGWPTRGPHHAFNRQYSLPGNLSMVTGQHDQFEQYEDGFLRSYGASTNPLQGVGDGLLQLPEFSSFPNRYGQFDGLMRTSLPYRSTDLSMLRLGDTDANGYPYQLGDYSTRGGNGYFLYRPANGR